MVEKKASKPAKVAKPVMTKSKAKTSDKIKCKVKDEINCSGSGGCFYFLGFIGALIYYISTAPTFWDAVIGFFKAIVWPAFLVYGLLAFIGA
jgi:hypothetical protein